MPTKIQTLIKMAKNVVISGGSKGIGRALVFRFAAEGFNVFTYSRSKSDLEKLKSELGKKHPQIKFMYKVCDASKKISVLSFANQVKKQMKTIDVLINNVGVFLPGSILKEKDGIFETTLQTNLASTYHLSRALIPLMIKRKKGHVFNVCSTASITAYSNGGSYCISKFGMLGFSKVLREELKTTNIRVTSVLPGATLTESWAGTKLPNHRFMSSEDIADAIFSSYRLQSAVVEELILRPQMGDIS